MMNCNLSMRERAMTARRKKWRAWLGRDRRW